MSNDVKTLLYVGLSLFAIALGGAFFFWLGRLSTHALESADESLTNVVQPQQSSTKQSTGQESFADNYTTVTPIQLSQEDRRLLNEIAQLHTEVSELNWQLVMPYKEFQAGLITDSDLIQQTAKPELEILERCTRMYELAEDIGEPKHRAQMTAFTGAILRRHRGFTMMIEGAASGDRESLRAGASLFEAARNDAIAVVIEMGDDDSAHLQDLKKLRDAYQAGSP